MLIVAGLGFRISAVPFHFYAPDVYQGTAIPGAALLAFLPKVAGFIALVRILGYAWLDTVGRVADPVTVVLWIMAAVTMTLGNVLAFLQNNVKRILGYSSVAHAGYMLIGLAVAPLLINTSSPTETPPVGGVESVVFYLIAYGAMTIGAFAVLSYLSTPERPVETVNDLSGAARRHPGVSLLMVLFLFSLVGMPMTAGFTGKMLLFLGALGVPTDQGPIASQGLPLLGAGPGRRGQRGHQRLLLSAHRRGHVPGRRAAADRENPDGADTGVPAALRLFTIWAGVYPNPFLSRIQWAIPARTESSRAAAGQVPAAGQGVATLLGVRLPPHPNP